MSELPIPLGLELSQHLKQACVRIEGAIVRAFWTLARLQPEVRTVAKYHIRGIAEHFVTRVPLETLQPRAIGIEKRSGALESAPWAARSHARVMQLHRQGEQQVPSVRMWPFEQLACSSLGGRIELRTREISVSVRSHGAGWYDR